MCTGFMDKEREVESANILGTKLKPTQHITELFLNPPKNKVTHIYTALLVVFKIFKQYFIMPKCNGLDIRTCLYKSSSKASL